MMIPALRSCFEQAETWPVEDQERLVDLFALVGHQASDALTISDEDAAEIERIMNNPNEEYLTADEFREAMADYLK